MFVITNRNMIDLQPTILNDTKDARDVIIGITGSIEEANAAYDAMFSMGFGDKYSRPGFEIYCVADNKAENLSQGEENVDFGSYSLSMMPL